MSKTNYSRHPKAALTTLGAVGTHLRNPWVTAWWSAALPGFGHLLVSNHFKGFVLLLWEFIVNREAHINAAIIFSFTGRFQEARDIVDHRWLLLYAAVYVYAIWDSYSETIEQNKYYILAEREDYPIVPAKFTAMEVGYGKKRKPSLAIMWSLLTPGLGHLYTKKIAEGFIILTWTIVFAYLSHVCEAIEFSLLGDFDKARSVVDYEWLLFLPSIYGYSAYASYAGLVELNKYYEAEQARFLRQTYMDSKYTMPM
ncbi:MAG: hypothetical protein K0R55_2602 [Sporomusa sp.]|nr:hypothetical protein [Sporomusa sp.]